MEGNPTNTTLADLLRVSESMGSVVTVRGEDADSGVLRFWAFVSTAQGRGEAMFDSVQAAVASAQGGNAQDAWGCGMSMRNALDSLLQVINTLVSESDDPELDDLTLAADDAADSMVEFETAFAAAHPTAVVGHRP